MSSISESIETLVCYSISVPVALVAASVLSCSILVHPCYTLAPALNIAIEVGDARNPNDASHEEPEPGR